MSASGGIAMQTEAELRPRRAPTPLGPTMHIRWVFEKGLWHIGAVFTSETACKLPFVLAESFPPGTPRAGDYYCPVCQKWLEDDWKAQGAE